MTAYEITIWPHARDRAWHGQCDIVILHWDTTDWDTAVEMASDYVARTYGNQHEGWSLYPA